MEERQFEGFKAATVNVAEFMNTQEIDGEEKTTNVVVPPSYSSLVPAPPTQHPKTTSVAQHGAHI